MSWVPEGERLSRGGQRPADIEQVACLAVHAREAVTSGFVGGGSPKVARWSVTPATIETLIGASLGC